MLPFVFGPVYSSRLGVSLGVSPLSDGRTTYKKCNYNCIYCQLGPSRTLINHREEFAPLNDLLEQLKEALRAISRDNISLDTVTIVPEGEPLLYSRLGELISKTKGLISAFGMNSKLAVITNGSLLYLREVRQELRDADIVLPSLDAANEMTFRRVNRPHRMLEHRKLVEGLKAFRKEYQGEIWLEVMVLEGINDSDEHVTALSNLIKEISPDMVNVNTPTRPPLKEGIRAPGINRLRSIEKVLSSRRSKKPKPESINSPLKDVFGLKPSILALIARHPMSVPELSFVFNEPQGKIKDTLKELIAEGKAIRFYRGGREYYRYRYREG